MRAHVGYPLRVHARAGSSPEVPELTAAYYRNLRGAIIADDGQRRGTTMNSYERVMAALEGREPDRVPLLEFVIDPRIVTAICPHLRTQTDFEEAMDFDAVGCATEYRKSPPNPD